MQPARLARAEVLASCDLREDLEAKEEVKNEKAGP